jgi:predicted ChrR family anti-sigma factor
MLQTAPSDAYAVFMLEYAAGALSDGERLAADLHRTLSGEGRRMAAVMEALGGALLEEHAARGPSTSKGSMDGALPAFPARTPSAEAKMDARLAPFLSGDLLALPWRRSLFRVHTLPTGVSNTKLLRLDPGQKAPDHGHARRDVTVVLQGCFSDEFGVYRRGDISFAEPGVRHAPTAQGDQPCVCLIAEEPPRRVGRHGRRWLS